MRSLAHTMLLLAVSSSVPGASLAPPRRDDDSPGPDIDLAPPNWRPLRQSFGPTEAKGKARAADPTPDDLARMEAAEAKRRRKAGRK